MARIYPFVFLPIIAWPFVLLFLSSFTHTDIVALVVKSKLVLSCRLIKSSDPSKLSALPRLPSTHVGFVGKLVSTPLFPLPEKSFARVDVPSFIGQYPTSPRSLDKEYLTSLILYSDC